MSNSLARRRENHSHLIIILLSIIVGVVLTVAWYHPKQVGAEEEHAAGVPTLESIEGAFAAIAEKARPAVVNISARYVRERKEPEIEIPGLPEDWPFGPFFRRPRRSPRSEPEVAESLGSGFFIRKNGYILTNNHVVEGAEDITVKLFDKREFSAEVVGTDKKTELAIIKISPEGEVPVLRLGDSDAARVGQWAIAIGSPFQQEWTLTVGVLSAKHRSIPGRTQYLRVNDLLQTDAAINPGNSGGPLLNVRGEVIGVNVAIRTEGFVPRSAGIGFAIPSNTAKFIVPQLIEHGKVARGYLGILYREMSPEEKRFYGTDKGVLVLDVTEGSPAAKAGFAPEDVIVKFKGRELNAVEDLEKIVAVTPPGETAEAVVIRAHKEKKLTVRLGSPPAELLGESGEESVAEKPGAAPDGTALGITVEPLTETRAEELGLKDAKGVVVTDIAVDSAAARTRRLEVGDVVFKVNDTPVKTPKEFTAAMKKAAKTNFIVLSVAHFLGEGKIQRDVVSFKPEK
ncbi:MAG: trypsin-like peptidase domain-containing protein [Armatimonadota bacterium]